MAEAERIWEEADEAGLLPNLSNDDDFYEAALRMLCHDLVDGHWTIAQLRSQFGGVDRERTIRNAAKVIASSRTMRA